MSVVILLPSIIILTSRICKTLVISSVFYGKLNAVIYTKPYMLLTLILFYILCFSALLCVNSYVSRVSYAVLIKQFESWILNLLLMWSKSSPSFFFWSTTPVSSRSNPWTSQTKSWWNIGGHLLSIRELLLEENTAYMWTITQLMNLFNILLSTAVHLSRTMPLSCKVWKRYYNEYVAYLNNNKVLILCHLTWSSCTIDPTRPARIPITMAELGKALYQWSEDCGLKSVLNLS